MFSEFPDNARIWLYQANHALTPEQVDLVNSKLKSFVKDWAAHGNKLWGDAKMINPYFIAVVVDDQKIPPSGCSIDASVKFIKSIGNEISVDFFTRTKLVVDRGGELDLIHFQELSNETIDRNLLIYDSLINQLGQLRAKWPIEISKSNFSQLLVD